MANCSLSGDRRVEKPVAVYLLGELLQMGDSRWSTAALFGGGFPRERAVDARFIIVGGESIELALKIQTSPEQDPYSRRMVPISRELNGCEQGTKGTVLSSSISSTRKIARQR